MAEWFWVEGSGAFRGLQGLGFAGLGFRGCTGDLEPYTAWFWASVCPATSDHAPGDPTKPAPKVEDVEGFQVKHRILQPSVISSRIAGTGTICVLAESPYTRLYPQNLGLAMDRPGTKALLIVLISQLKTTPCPKPQSQLITTVNPKP